MSHVSSTSSVIERALEETISLLTREHATPKARAILIEARRLRSMVASWKAIPPPAPARKELYANAMQLFAKAGIPSPQVPHSTPRMPAVALSPPPAPPSGFPSAPPPASAPRSVPPARSIASLDDPLADHSFTLDEPSHGLVSEDEPPPRSSQRTPLGRGIAVHRPRAMEWRPLPHAPGVMMKVLCRDEATGIFRALLRMGQDAELPRHRHAAPEEMLVVEGSLFVGKVEIAAGDYCIAEAGTVHETAQSPRGCTLFMIGSEHDELLPG